MKIYLQMEVSENTNRRTIDLESVGLSEEEWLALTPEEKHDILQELVHEFEQPYWVLDGFTEEEA
jgi:hypothetical protein